MRGHNLFLWRIYKHYPELLLIIGLISSTETNSKRWLISCPPDPTTRFKGNSTFCFHGEKKKKKKKKNNNIFFPPKFRFQHSFGL